MSHPASLSQPSRTTRFGTGVAAAPDITASRKCATGRDRPVVHVDRFPRLHRPGLQVEPRGRVDHDVPRAPERCTRQGERERLVVRVEKQQKALSRTGRPSSSISRKASPFRNTANDLVCACCQSSSTISSPSGLNHAISPTPAPRTARPLNHPRRRNAGWVACM